jgi:hypothetical protein
MNRNKNRTDQPILYAWSIAKCVTSNYIEIGKVGLHTNLKFSPTVMTFKTTFHSILKSELFLARQFGTRPSFLSLYLACFLLLSACSISSQLDCV